MAVMAPPDCLKWPETPQPRPGYIKKYISSNIVLANIVVVISNFTQPLVKLWTCSGNEEAQIGPDLVICYLCNKKVLRSEWEKVETDAMGDHRSYCAVKTKEHRGRDIIY